MCINVKISNRNKLQFKVLVNLECTHTEINKQLVKGEWIETEPMDGLFKVFNTDGTKNGKMTRFVLLELEINRHIKRINTVVIDLNSTNMFLGYN